MPQRGFCWRRRFADKTNKSPFNDVEGGDLALCALPKEVAQADLCDTFVPAGQCSSFSAVHEMIPVLVTFNPFHLCIRSGIFSVAAFLIIANFPLSFLVSGRVHHVFQTGLE